MACFREKKEKNKELGRRTGVTKLVKKTVVSIRGPVHFIARLGPSVASIPSAFHREIYNGSRVDIKQYYGCSI